MGTIQEIIHLCKNEQGKVFVINEKGEVSLVILGMDEYHRLRGEQPHSPSVDPEAVNRQILQAQLEELDKELTSIKQATAQIAAGPKVAVGNLPGTKKVDLREEVIDPSFDFDSEDEV